MKPTITVETRQASGHDSYAYSILSNEWPAGLAGVEIGEDEVRRVAQAYESGMVDSLELAGFEVKFHTHYDDSPSSYPALRNFDYAGSASFKELCDAAEAVASEAGYAEAREIVAADLEYWRGLTADDLEEGAWAEHDRLAAEKVKSAADSLAKVESIIAKLESIIAAYRPHGQAGDNS
jgi:hypothetical protein